MSSWPATRQTGEYVVIATKHVVIATRQTGEYVVIATRQTGEYVVIATRQTGEYVVIATRQTARTSIWFHTTRQELRSDSRICRHGHQTDSKNPQLVPHSKAGSKDPHLVPHSKAEIGSQVQRIRKGLAEITSASLHWVFATTRPTNWLTVQKILTVPKKKVGCLPSLGFCYYPSEHLSLYGYFKTLDG